MVTISVVEFAYETIVLLISGCVAIISISGLCATITYFGNKYMKHLGSNKKSFPDSNTEVNVYDEPVSRDQKAELASQPESNVDVAHAQINHWFLKSNEPSKLQTLRTLPEYLQITVASTTGSNYDKDAEIREFLEHLVGTLISENLDDVLLTPLSQDEQYTEIFAKYHSKLSTTLTTLSASLHSNKDSESLDAAVRPSTLYGQLQSVIRQVQEDASLLPSLADYDAECGPASIETRLEGQSYEDILTTAVLNKIVSRSQKKESHSSKNNNAELVNSVGDRINNGSWYSSPKEKFSLLIEEHIEEVTTRYVPVSEDKTDSIVETSIKDNLLRKHRAQFPELGKDIVDAKDVISPMKTNYMYKYDFNSSLETPTFKNDVDNESEGFGGDHDQDSSGVTSISRDISDVYSFSSVSPCRSDEESLPWSGMREAKNEHLLLGQVDSGEGSLETQPENEYLNHDEMCESSISEELSPCETFNIHTTAKNLQNNDSESSLVENLATPPKPGTIAEREHQKWEQASPILNNPYSKENLERRNLDNFLPKTCAISTISNQYERNKFDNTINGAISMGHVSKYERDYYVNADKKKCEEHKVERRTRSVSEDRPVQNGFGNMSDNESVSEKRQPNLVRLSSWSDRKKPDIEIRRKLPSVKELAKQFSGENNSYEMKKMALIRNHQMVHSLTARSMTKEFREGLKNNVNKIYNRNILSNGQDVTDNLQENHTEEIANIQKGGQTAIIN